MKRRKLVRVLRKKGKYVMNTTTVITKPKTR